jgi:hypothetical protein
VSRRLPFYSQSAVGGVCLDVRTLRSLHRRPKGGFNPFPDVDGRPPFQHSPGHHHVRVFHQKSVFHQISVLHLLGAVQGFSAFRPLPEIRHQEDLA